MNRRVQLSCSDCHSKMAVFCCFWSRFQHFLTSPLRIKFRELLFRANLVNLNSASSHRFVVAQFAVVDLLVTSRTLAGEILQCTWNFAQQVIDFKCYVQHNRMFFMNEKIAWWLNDVEETLKHLFTINRWQLIVFESLRYCALVVWIRAK